MPEMIHAYQLNWNPMTIEGYNEIANEATMVFNCDLTTKEKSENVVQYVTGRTVWCCQNFPPNIKITLSFDIRGQGIILTKTTIFKDRILRLMSDLCIDNQILIDFLR